jgi:protein phosphatase 1 regulatory subunit 7
VYFVQNRISKIVGLETLGPTLRSLELGGNRIRVRTTSSACLAIAKCTQTIENLDALVNLEELWLGKNKITKLQVLSFPGRHRGIANHPSRI